ncbi:MAG: hypothetical protein DRP78_01015 [Candidatus Omnitrophota bacterium]|nr:MAG: hypothetical protein DRP78_01015 [Candidatus Omnitrophota bacterium]
MRRIKLFAIFLSIFLFIAVNGYTNIVLKVVGISSSKTKVQKIVLKSYLPKEITPEDIIDKDDLDLLYDTQQSAYYVYGEYDLSPGESVEREVEMKDIWGISEARIVSLQAEADKTVELLKGTSFAERALFLRDSIKEKLDKIVQREKIAALNPQRHISDYRSNVELLETAQKDLILARSFLSQVSSLPPVAIWKVFFVVIGILFLLSIILYLSWYRQSMVVKTSTNSIAEHAFDPSSVEAKENNNIGENENEEDN